MACDLMYVARHVRGINVETEPARRGTEVHKVIASYMEALSVGRVQTDYAKMEQLARDTGPESKEILSRFCESFFIDSDKIYDMELYISCDEDFKVLEVRGRSERKKQHDPRVVYEGSLDLVVMESMTTAEIYDWKTYYQIVDADTFQSKLYPLLLFLLNPAIEQIRFVLGFVRYGDAQRDVTWTRADVPELMEIARRARVRQVGLHSLPEEKLTASPGRQCAYCPLLLTECPMLNVNPFANVPKEERVAIALWMTAAKKENDRILKDWLIEGEPIVYADKNGTKYVAQFKESERKSYPLGSVTSLLSAWILENKKDVDLWQKLTVGGLSSPLKAEKRRDLAKQMVEIADIKKLTKLSIGLADDDEDEAA